MSQTLSQFKNFRGYLQSSKCRDFWKMCAAGGLCAGQLSHISSLLGEFKLSQLIFVLVWVFWYCTAFDLCDMECGVGNRKKTWCLKTRNYPALINCYYWNIVLDTIVLNSGETKISTVHAHHPQPICRWNLHKLIFRRN